MLLALILGFIAGFIAAVPVAGPVAVLVLHEALAGKKSEARQIALGSAVAESLYAGVAFAGIGAVFDRFPVLLPVSRIVSAAILIIVGIYLIAKRREKEKQEEEEAIVASQRPGRSKWLVGLSITALNPTLIASWTAVVAALHGAGIASSNPLEALPFALGIGLGIMSWFVVLLAIVGRFREKLSPNVVHRGVQIVGGLLAAGGVAMAVRTAIRFLAR
jgi:threonine/homoserine/homoserine lactone efflux protein